MTERRGYSVSVFFKDGWVVVAAFLSVNKARKWALERFPSGSTQVAGTTWAKAVGSVRALVLRRDGLRCIRCGKVLTEETAHMDEKVSRGKGGEVSIFNCRTMCAEHHVSGEYAKHSDRRPKFTRIRV